MVLELSGPGRSDDQPEIFLSYGRKSENQLPNAKRICDILTSQGFKVWMDESIPPGEDWGEELVDALERADFFVICLDRQTDEGNFVFEEISAAIGIANRKKDDWKSYIIQIRFVEDALKLRQLRRYQAVDWFKEGAEEHLCDTLYEEWKRRQQNNATATSPVRQRANANGQAISWDSYVEQVLGRRDFSEDLKNHVPLSVKQERFIEDHKTSVVGELPSGQVDSLTDIVSRNSRVALLGEPGSGKTWMLRKLFVDLAQANEPSQIPVYLNLKSWGSFVQNSEGQDPDWQNRASSGEMLLCFIWQEVRNTLRTLGQASVTKATTILRSELKTRRFQLIFDGYDEIREHRFRSAFLIQLKDLLNTLQDTKIGCIIGSRRHVFGNELAKKLSKQTLYVGTTSLTRDQKIAILQQYSPGDADPEDVLKDLNRNHRTARLVDNTLLLRLLAPHAMKKGADTLTRGLILEQYAIEAIEHTSQLNRGRAFNFLGILATLIRETGAGYINESQTLFAHQELSDIAKTEQVTVPEMLEKLISTRLIQREEADATILRFTLPQFEEYFLARIVRDKISEWHRTMGSTTEDKPPYIAEPEWHHTLILAVGLLRDDEAELFASLIDSDRNGLLKARILAEAKAPDAEHQFVDGLLQRIRTSTGTALKRLSIASMTSILLWWLGLVPLALVVSEIAPSSPRITTIAIITYLIGIPLFIGWGHPLIFSRLASAAKRDTREALRSLACLRSATVSRALEEIRRRISRLRPSPWADNEDEYVKLVDAVAEEIDWAIELGERDLDTVLDELDKDRRNLEHWLSADPSDFQLKEVRLLAEILERRSFDWEKDQIRCVDKLVEVVFENPIRSGEIIEIFENILNSGVGTTTLRHAIQDAVDKIKAPRQGTAKRKGMGGTIVAILTLLATLAYILYEVVASKPK